MFALLGLFTGAFLIFNTFSMLVAQRTRELALYRAFGASRGQVNRAVLVEAALLGLVSSVLGLLLGMGVGWALAALLESFSNVDLPGPRPVAAPVAPAQTGELAVSEQSDFDAAKAVAEKGDDAQAAALFGKFLADYPSGPLSTEAQFRRGEALAATADWRGAAHSFLDAFSGAPQGPFAPRALYRLASSLKELGNVNEACLTLTEVVSRYPGSAEAAEVPSQRQAFGCQ